MDKFLERRRFLRESAGLVAAVSLPWLGGCEAKMTCARDAWYKQKETDFIERFAGAESAEKLVSQVVLSVAKKLSRALQPDYLKFPNIESEPGEPKKREEKKMLGVLDIYSKESASIRIFGDYLTDALVAACMADVRIGENFRVAERYKLQTLLKEFDMRKGIQDFDPRDAIKRGFFKGVGTVLTGNIYTTSATQDKDGNTSYRGGAQFLVRLIDVTDADIVANAVESFPRNPLVNEWLEKQVANPVKF